MTDRQRPKKSSLPAADERRVCLRILGDVLEKGSFLHLRLREEFSGTDLTEEQRAFITRLAKGCVESLPELDAKINEVSSVRTGKMKPVIRNILRMSAYQLLYMEVPPHAVCNEAVRLTSAFGLQPLKGFVNAVCRSLARRLQENTEQGSEEKEIKTAGTNNAGEKTKAAGARAGRPLPEWLTDALGKWYGPEYPDEFRRSLSARDHTKGIRLLTARHSEEEIVSLLEKDGAILRKAPFGSSSYLMEYRGDIRKLEAYRDGLFIIQDPASSLAAECLSPERGSLVIDVCSAPGGKAIAVADLMGGTGTVISRDVSERKCDQIRENLRRCRIENVKVECRDAALPDELNRGGADYVLADVPCSGLGVLRQKPDIVLHLSAEGISSLVQLQRAIASNAADLLKPGGILVYSTCTVNPEENLENAQWLLSRGDLVLCDLTPFVSTCSDRETLKTGMLQLLPGKEGSSGFFIARFQKKS